MACALHDRRGMQLWADDRRKDIRERPGRDSAGPTLASRFQADQTRNLLGKCGRENRS